MTEALKKVFFILTLVFFITIPGYSQKEFFRSGQIFNKEQLNNFYSSISIQGDLLFFNANDYSLYAYNKNDGSLKWVYKTIYKSDIPVFVHDSIVYAGIYTNEQQRSAQIDVSSGKLIRALPFGPLVTKPFIKNGILYGTAIYNYGCIVAYDINKDTVYWSRFLAHGYSRQPYYDQNKILANAESHNWAELGYDGMLLDTTCTVKPDFFVEGISCVRVFTALTHDGLEIKGKQAENIIGEQFDRQPDIIRTKNFTYVLNGDKLSVLAGKLKQKLQVQVSSLSTALSENDYKPVLLKADDDRVWLLHSGHLLQYNHKTKKVIRERDLTEWQPQQVLIEEQNIWLVSQKDGLLYGLSL